MPVNDRKSYDNKTFTLFSVTGQDMIDYFGDPTQNTGEILTITISIDAAGTVSFQTPKKKFEAVAEADFLDYSTRTWPDLGFSMIIGHVRRDSIKHRQLFLIWVRPNEKDDGLLFNMYLFKNNSPYSSLVFEEGYGENEGSASGTGPK